MINITCPDCGKLIERSIEVASNAQLRRAQAQLLDLHKKNGLCNQTTLDEETNSLLDEAFVARLKTMFAALSPKDREAARTQINELFK